MSDTASWLTVLGSVGLTIVGFVAKKYLLPFLTVGRRQRYAEFIAKIADEIISDLRVRYPDKEWLKHVDEAVELLVEITEASTEVSRRAIRAAIQR